VPVGIVSSDIAQTVEAFRKRIFCPECGARGHVSDSRYCRACAAELVVGEMPPSSGNWASTPRIEGTGAASTAADDQRDARS
jgi:hypothetical protein